MLDLLDQPLQVFTLLLVVIASCLLFEPLQQVGITAADLGQHFADQPAP
ncbi:MAG: hypothetical protein ACN6QE_19830 [Pseudomonas putida]